METIDFDFELPQHLIAQYPHPERTHSKLLCLNKISGAIKDSYFDKLPDLLDENDSLVTPALSISHVRHDRLLFIE